MTHSQSLLGVYLLLDVAEGADDPTLQLTLHKGKFDSVAFLAESFHDDSMMKMQRPNEKRLGLYREEIVDLRRS